MVFPESVSAQEKVSGAGPQSVPRHTCPGNHQKTRMTGADPEPVPHVAVSSSNATSVDVSGPISRGRGQRVRTRKEGGLMTWEGRLGVVVKPAMAIAVVLAAAFPVTASSATAMELQPECQGRQATIVGTSGSDNLVGTAGRDVIVARGGSDDIESRGGNDVICAGRGRDDVLSGRGRDRVFGASGADELVGGADNDRLFGQRGNDVLLGNRGADLLDGGRGFDRGNGGRGSDTCRSVEIDINC
jgi:RTX calcium-binding nonapeptide repeat (4 copies)